MTETPTRERIHQMIAMQIRNRTVVRFTPPTDDAGPAHARDGGALLLRLSPAEADIATSAAIKALEELGVIPAQEPSHGDLARAVESALRDAGHAEAGDADFGWCRHRPLHSGAHLLVTCEPDDMWQAMPGQAVRTAIAQHLARYAETLRKAGLGVAEWVRRDQLAVLIVAADQGSADEQAPDIRAHLDARNPADGDNGREDAEVATERALWPNAPVGRVCSCGHVEERHNISPSSGKRTGCSTSWGPKATPCPCTEFTAEAAP